MNAIIFEGKEISVWKVVSRIVSNYSEFHKDDIPYKIRIPRQPCFFLDGPFGVF